MSRFKKSAPWVVGVAGLACLTLSAWSWAQRGPAPQVVPVDPQAIAAANSLSQAFRGASQNSLPAIVSIEVRGKPVAMRGGDGGNPGDMFKGSPFEELFKQDPRFKEFFGPRGGGATPQPRPQGMGSGFLIDSRGVIMTAAHVVADADQVKVRLHDGREYIASEVKSDPKTDIAIVKIEAEGPLPYIPLGNSDEVEVGDWVLAIGSPFGLDATVTAESSVPRDAARRLPSGKTSCRPMPPSTPETAVVRWSTCGEKWSGSTRRSRPAAAAMTVWASRCRSISPAGWETSWRPPARSPGPTWVW